MLILEKLWKGDVAPGERCHISKGEYSKSYTAMVDSEEYLHKHLTGEALQQFQQFRDADNEITALNIQEANLEFYRKITELHRANLLSNMEWDSFFRAFYFAADNIDAEDLSDEHPLVYGIYILIKKHRELISIQQHRNIQDYEDLFGSLRNNFDNYYE